MNEVKEIPNYEYYHHEMERLWITPRPIFVNKHIPKIPQENDYGRREYKYKLSYNPGDMSQKRREKESRKKEKIASQMLYRLMEGNGKAVYIIGVLDNGDNVGITLKETFESIHFFIDSAKIIQAKIGSIKIYQGKFGYITTIRISLQIDLHYNLTLF
jgi:GTPase